MREDGRPFHQVFQLTDIAGPSIAGKDLQCLGRHGLDVLLHALGVVLGEIADEGGDIFPSIAQRRHRDWKDIEPIVEIVAKLFRLYHSLEIPIGRGNQADIHPYRLGTAQPFEFLFLQHTKQLGL